MYLFIIAHNLKEGFAGDSYIHTRTSGMADLCRRFPGTVVEPFTFLRVPAAETKSKLNNYLANHRRKTLLLDIRKEALAKKVLLREIQAFASDFYFEKIFSIKAKSIEEEYRTGRPCTSYFKGGTL